MTVTFTTRADARCPRCGAPGVMVAYTISKVDNYQPKVTYTCSRNPLPIPYEDAWGIIRYRDRSHPDWDEPATEVQ